MTEGKTKSRLGRGLSSLISISSDVPLEQPAETSPGPGDIPLGMIVPNPHQPRRTINPAAIAELALSLKSTGLIQPIVVRKVEQGYELIAGERRWRAAKEAGFASIPAIVRDVDQFTQAQMALIENIQREDLNVIDRAAAYRTIIQQLGLTQAELAQRLGEERSSVANYLRILDLSEPVRELVKEGKLHLGHAKLLAGIPGLSEQERLAKLVAARDLSVRELERLIQKKQGPSKSDQTGPSSAYLGELEKSLSRQLGLRVQVKASSRKGKGRLVIRYNTLDEFDQLMKALGVKPEE
jgi:ParB family chromosome partitioning protein